MKKLIRRLSSLLNGRKHRQVIRTCGTHGDQRSRHRLRRWRKVVPRGHVPVFVGEEMKWFLVAAELLGRPAFVELLRRSAEEYGYGQSGVLRIPCSVPLFRRVLRSLARDSSGDPGNESKEEIFEWVEE